MMNAVKSVTALMAVGLVFALAPAAEASTWGGSGGDTSVDDLIPKMSSGQAYSERYGFAVDLDNGAHVGIDFTISNLGIRNGYGASEVRIRHPDIDNYQHSERVSPGDWSYDENSFQLDIGPASVEATDDGAYELRYADDNARVELRFEPTIGMWQPGSGEIRSGDDYYRFTLVSPRANVTGRIQWDGEWHEVEGTRSGYSDHVATNVAPYNLAKRFTRFRSYVDDAFVMWREVDLTDDFGGESVTWVVVGVGDEIVYEDPDAEVRFGEIERDAETEYLVPHAIQTLSKTGGDQFRLTLRGNDVERRDLLEGRGRAARMIARAVSDPFQFNVQGDFQLEVVAGEHRLRSRDSGHVTIDYVNQ